MDIKGKAKTSSSSSSCELCAYFYEDEDTGMSICHMCLDEDEMVNYLRGSFNNCPYFRLYDEYAIVRKQN